MGSPFPVERRYRTTSPSGSRTQTVGTGRSVRARWRRPSRRRFSTWNTDASSCALRSRIGAVPWPAGRALPMGAASFMKPSTIGGRGARFGSTAIEMKRRRRSFRPVPAVAESQHDPGEENEYGEFDHGPDVDGEDDEWVAGEGDCGDTDHGFGFPSGDLEDQCGRGGVAGSKDASEGKGDGNGFTDEEPQVEGQEEDLKGDVDSPASTSARRVIIRASQPRTPRRRRARCRPPTARRRGRPSTLCLAWRSSMCGCRRP